MSDVTALSSLLEQERAAILAGTFDEISQIAVQKERLLERLTRVAAPVADLRRIAAEISRNQTLLAASIEGVRSVIDRIADLRRARDGFESYGPEGARTQVGARGPSFERKA